MAERSPVSRSAASTRTGMPCGAAGAGVATAGAAGMALAGRSASSSFTFLLVGLAPGTHNETEVSAPVANASA